MENKLSLDLDSGNWRVGDPEGITECFIKSGFGNTEQLLTIPVFDLLKISGIDSGKASRMIINLYERFNGNPETDLDMELGFASQYFDYGEWRSRHRNKERVKVGDLVLEENINRKAVLHLYDGLVKAFYRSRDRDDYSMYYSYETYAKRKGPSSGS